MAYFSGFTVKGMLPAIQGPSLAWAPFVFVMLNILCKRTFLPHYISFSFTKASSKGFYVRVLGIWALPLKTMLDDRAERSLGVLLEKIHNITFRIFIQLLAQPMVIFIQI